MEYLKQQNESDLEYIIRLIEGKSNGIYDIDYIELFKLGFGIEISSCEARKRYYGLKMLLPYLDNEKIKSISDDDILKEYELKRIEFEKEKQRFFDQRNSYKKLIRDDARWDELKDIISYSINNIKPYKNENLYNIQYSDNDLLIGLNDLHYGVMIDNFWNKYSPEIAKERLEKYLNEIISIQKLHNSENCYVCANGDLISGLIHLTIQLANRENVVQQVMGVSELLSWFLSELSKYFKNVYFSAVAGNHTRLSPNKDNAPKDERLDDLIPFYIKARLQNINNIIVNDDKVDNTISLINIRGLNYCLVHGDMDNINNVLRLVSMLPDKVYGIFMGHLHHNSSDFIQGYKVFMSGSLMGMDDLCVERRIFGKPQQLVCVCDSDGVKCTYDINFNLS